MEKQWAEKIDQFGKRQSGKMTDNLKRGVESREVKATNLINKSVSCSNIGWNRNFQVFL